ncbi:MAG: hypothetical protein ACYCT0_12325, partial [Sulfobacillus sp.]
MVDDGHIPIPFIANTSAADALALGHVLLLFVNLMVAPWIPGINRLPRFIGVHRIIYAECYRHHPIHPKMA